MDIVKDKAILNQVALEVLNIESISPTTEVLSIEIIDKILRHIDVSSSILSIERGIGGKVIKIISSEGEEDSSLKPLKERLAGIEDFDNFINELSRTIYYGYTVFEKIYSEDFSLKKLEHIPRESVFYDKKKRVWKIRSSGDDLILEESKFLISTYRSSLMMPLGDSLFNYGLHQAFVDLETLEAKLRGLQEKYGAVIPVFGYNAKILEQTGGVEKIKKRAEEVKAMSDKNVLAIPISGDSTLKDSFFFISLSDLKPEMHTTLLKRIEKKIEKFLKGSTFSDGDTGSYSKDQIQQTEKEKMENDIIKFLVSELKKLIVADSILFGYDDTKYYFSFEDKETREIMNQREKEKHENKKIQLENLQQAKKLGYQPKKEKLAEVLGVNVNDLEETKGSGMGFSEFSEGGVVNQKRKLNRQKVLSYKKKTEEVENIFSESIREQLEKQLKKVESIEDLLQIELNLDFLEDSMILGILQGIVDEDDIANSSIIAEFSEDGNIYNNNFSAAIEFFLSKKPELYEKIEPITLEVRSNFHWIKKSTELETTKKLIDNLGKALKSGQDLRGWKKASKDILDKTGFGDNAWYLNNVYRTNTISAYSAGRYTQQEELKDTFPYWLYDAVDDKRTTLLCSSLDEKVYKADDPFWNNYYPPNHYQCRSSVIALTKEEAKAEGLKISKIGSDQIGNELKTFKGNPAQMWKNAEKSVKLKKIVVIEKAKDILLDLSAIEDEGMREVYERAFKNSPESIRKIVSKNIDKAKEFIYDGGYYQKYSKTISIDKKKNNYITAAHEFGHFIDNTLGEQINGMKNTYLSCDPYNEKFKGFYDSVEKAIKSLSRSKGNIAKRNGLKAEVIDRFGEDVFKKEYGAFQDIINGVTKGKVRINWGHSDKYWKRSGATEKEVFAELFEIYSETVPVASKKQKEYLKELFPDMIIEFEKVLEEFSK